MQLEEDKVKNPKQS